ncbi:hypothetical protein DYB37_000688 [Aphanomyces astaci]|uniref:Uncharacterized protein n=1 Tax=Aphanomyces astaci TaxID=112090 RepID=A0A397BDZ9_APHAT|nr:hypothetical protein DYB25_000216 [Aphanomyces astaci]RHY50297.1 hypothetical protein DYB30_000637 [Aphanomyces astaci]RHZ01480.1 hypothetical protein DYB35_000797 [Aphanomyces astaci]RHZ09177.1 hypothetical protein DYB37_000688 [Aphanomyces astaci]
MKLLHPSLLAVASLASVTTAADTISVLGAGVFTIKDGRTPCSGSNTDIIGACPESQNGLQFGSCCVEIPGRSSVVMGCAPLQSAADSCANVAARLNAQKAAQPTDAPATTAKNPSVTLESSLLTTLSPSTKTDAPTQNTAPTLPASLVIETTSAAPVAATTTTAAPKAADEIALQQSPMSDAADSSTALSDTTFSNANSILVGASIIGVAVAVIGGVLFVRKNKDRSSNVAASPSTPPQPASMAAVAAFPQETPYNDDDFLTPKDDLVCL